jgi:hypothetical protein
VPAIDGFSWLAAARVKAALGRSIAGGTDQDLEDARKAAATFVERRRPDLVWLDATDQDVPADVWLGAVLLTNRLLARRGSPQGVAELGEFGPAHVARTDPDVERLLGIGRYGKPVVG